MLRAFADKGNARSLMALDLDRCESLSEEGLYKFLLRFGPQLRGLVLSGIPHVTDQLWTGTLPSLRQVKILVMGMTEGCCPKINQKVSIILLQLFKQKKTTICVCSIVQVLVDQLVDCIAQNCSQLERLELRWDPETLRYSDKSQKAIDTLRVRCLRLKCLVLR